MKILPIMQSNYNKKQTDFKGTYQFSMPLRGNGNLILQEIRLALAQCNSTSLETNVNFLTGNTNLKMSFPQETDMSVMDKLRQMVPVIKSMHPKFKIYRKAVLHGLDNVELKQTEIATPHDEIF